MPTEPNPPFADDNFLRLVTTDDQGLTRIDIDSNEPAAADVERFPWSLAAGDGSLWVGHHVVPNVVRLDPLSLEELAEVPL